MASRWRGVALACAALAVAWGAAACVTPTDPGGTDGAGGTDRTDGTGETGDGTPGGSRSAAPSGAAQPVVDGAPRVITVDGRERTYRMWVPADEHGRAAEGLPVVLVLHGGGGSGEQTALHTGIAEAAVRAGFVAVFPDGTGRRALLTWNAGTCCAYAAREGVDDVAFLAAVIDDVLADVPADPRRVFATGMSNGAMMAYRLACELSDRVLGVASVAGALNVEPCEPVAPVSLLAIHGTADRSVPYGGGPPADPPGSLPPWVNASVAESVGFWARHDGCDATPADERTGAVTVSTYRGCDRGSAVVLHTVDGGGHAWPGGAKGRAVADDVPPEPDATAVILDFFAALPPR